MLTRDAHSDSARDFVPFGAPFDVSCVCTARSVVVIINRLTFGACYLDATWRDSPFFALLLLIIRSRFQLEDAKTRDETSHLIQGGKVSGVGHDKLCRKKPSRFFLTGLLLDDDWAPAHDVGRGWARARERPSSRGAIPRP